MAHTDDRTERRHILVVVADPNEARELAAKINGRGMPTVVVHTRSEAWQRFDVLSCAGLIIDANLPDGSGFDLQRWIHDRWPRVEVMLLGEPEGDLPDHLELRDGRVHLRDGVDLASLPQPPPLPKRQRQLPTSEQIAADMGTSVEEVDDLIASVCKKVGVSSAEELVERFREEVERGL